MELNPNHPVARKAHGQWHKIAALILIKQGLTEVKLTLEDVNKLTSGNINIVLDERKEFAGDGLVIRLVDDKTAAGFARKEGGRTIDN